MKRIISCLLALALIIAVFPISSFASDNQELTFSLNYPDIKQQYKVNQPETKDNAMEYGWYVEFTDGISRFRVATAHWKQPNASPATMSLHDMQTNLWFWDGNSFKLVSNCELKIGGTELTWKAAIPAKYDFNADSARVVLEQIVINGQTVYSASAPSSDLKDIKVGGQLLLGNMNGTPISWEVQSIEGDRALLLCENTLDFVKLGGNGLFGGGGLYISYDNTTLDTWCINLFNSTCFTDEERDLILTTSIDDNYPVKIFILSAEEYDQLISVKKSRPVFSGVAGDYGAFDIDGSPSLTHASEGDQVPFWTRTGLSQYWIRLINEDGSYTGSTCANLMYTGSQYGMCPAFYISLSKLNNSSFHTSLTPNSELSLTAISPNYTSVNKDDVITLVFNKEVDYGNGYLTLREMNADGKTGRFDLNNRNGIATISGNTVTINLGEIILPDGWYDAEISPKAFKSKDGDYFLGMPGKGLWQFEVCSGLAQESVMQYAQKGHYFWKSDDTTKPAIPNGSDSEYASILMSWFDQYELQSISKQELISELSDPMYLPVTDVNGSTVLLNDKSTTVKQTLEDILFFEGLKPFAAGIDGDLAKIVQYKQSGKLNVNPLHQERSVYKKVLGWYPQVDEYLSRRNGNSNLFFSSVAPIAYTGLLSVADNVGGSVYKYTKPFLKAELDSALLQSSLNGLSQYANYSDFKTGASKVKSTISAGKIIYTAYSEGAPAGGKAIIKFGFDLLQTYFKDSNNSTLKDIGEAWSDYDAAMGAGELCAFLGGSIGAFPMVIELYDDLSTKVKDSVAACYFIGDYYVAEKYPDLYDAIYDDETGFPEYDLSLHTIYPEIENDPILYNWCECLYRAEGTMRDDCRQLRFDLVNYIMLLKYAQEFDADAAKKALVKYISAECNQQKTTEFYASCPVTVEVYSKENDQLVATLSSEDEDIFSCEYGSLYLMGEDNETKCFVLNSSDYYASILPYANGTMNVAVVSTDENGLPVGKTFSDVALSAGNSFKLDLDDMDTGLQTQSGEIIEKESTVPVQRINISGESEVAVGATITLYAEVLPKIATEKGLTWTSADASIATVDNNGTITGVAFGETVITATSADGATEDYTISVFVPSTELHVDKTQLRMVKGESFALHASTTEGASHSVRWKSNNLNSVVVSADGVLTAKEAGDAIVTASIDGKEAEVIVVVSDESMDVMMYQTDLDGNALHLAMTNPSCEKSLSGSAYVAVYESGRMIDLKKITIDLESNQEKTEIIALPDFSAEKTYSAIFYPLGDMAQDMQPEEIVFVNGSYELKDSTEAASSELTKCQKATVTYDNAQPGVGYTLYVLSDDSGVPTEENIVYLGHKKAENENLTFTICLIEENQDKECYVYVSDAENELHYLSPFSGLGHKTELSGVKEATCTADGYSGDEVCTICGETIDKGVAIPAAGHKWDSGKITKGPTETNEGVRTYTCTVCGETRTESIPKLSPVMPPALTNPFLDVKHGAYYYDPVLWAVNHNPQITNGMSATTFSPDATCTRGQVVTFLWRAAGEPKPTSAKNPFTDVKADAYYFNAVMWAVEKGITNGTSASTFSPNDPCTRAHVVTFLWRSQGGENAGSSNPFTDVPSGQYYTTAVLWAVNHKPQITNGTSATTFSPSAPCTRGQIVTFLYRCMG